MLSRHQLQCHEGIMNQAIYEWDYKKQLLSIQNDKMKKVVTDDYLIERPISKSLKTSTIISC